MATINAIGNSSYTLTVDGGSIIATGLTLNGDYSVTMTSADASGPDYLVNRDRLGAAIVPGDGIGIMYLNGQSTSTNTAAAYFAARSDGTIAAGKVPGYIEFKTMSDGVVTFARRMHITTGGSLVISTPVSGGVSLAVDADIELSGTATATQDVRCRTFFATGDKGTGVVSRTAITNVTNVAANSTGVLTVKSKSGNPLDSSGFIKFWIGTTEFYVPLFSNPAP